MADENETVPVEAVEETPAAAAPAGKMDTMTALQEVLKNAVYVDGLARGVHEVTKALDKGAAHLCVLASKCDEPNIVKLVEALCAERNINLIKVDDRKLLGQWAGLCKLDQDGTARKVVGCSCVAVKDYGVMGEAVDVLNEHFKSESS
eukprot:TRINITY_DN7561_c0_g1_i3.p1 TRINITY_DN7561_c0_g1~~TRINITY_DN7561_c0_g1_i3.p1  ORF type:complete len:148 (+),score=50.76 TRINITY_DN7561_c0_g1_i3:117-560(+)